jgi:hypothetical protein
MNFTRLRAGAALAGLVAAAAVAAGAAAPDTARVRFVNAAPKSPALVLWVDGKKTGAAVPYRKSLTWLTLPSGSHKLEVFPAKKKGDPLFTLDAFMLESGSYTAVVCKPPVADPNTAFLLHERMPPPDDVATVRYFNALEGMEFNSAYLESGTLLGEHIPFCSGAEYHGVAPGKAVLSLKSPLGDETVTFPPVTLGAGKRYTLIAAGPESLRQTLLLED